MTKDLPQITIGMPVFNDIEFIERSLISILKQSYKNFTLIISDDGATDGSEEICKEYAKLDTRIKYIRQPKNLGISKNMEFLIRKADTPYFMWAADDDLWTENFIEYHITALERDQNAIVSFGCYNVIDENDTILDLIDANYSSSCRLVQLLKLIYIEDDGFGYGVFRTAKIKKVKFPIWWWPNKKTPYNNIYPSLYYYLNNGKYLHRDQPLFFKRVKIGANVNHVLAGKGNGAKELFAFYLRRFYLVIFSSLQMVKSPTAYNVIFVFPFLFIKVFIYASLKITIVSILRKFRIIK